MKEKIEKAVKKLGLYEKKVFTAKELNQICKEVGCDLGRVMFYLRYER